MIILIRLIFLFNYTKEWSSPSWSSPELIYKLFPSTMASLTKKDPEDKREPRLQQVFWTVKISSASNSVLRMVLVFWAMVMETKTAGVRWQEPWEGRSAHRRQLDEDQRPGSPCQVSYDSSQGSHHPSYSGRKSKRVLQVLDPCSFPLQFSILKMEKWNWIAGTRLLQLSTSSHSSMSSFCWPEDQGSQMDITTNTELWLHQNFLIFIIINKNLSVGYWDYIMVAEYVSQESFCRMAVSKEYTDIVPHKVWSFSLLFDGRQQGYWHRPT